MGVPLSAHKNSIFQLVAMTVGVLTLTRHQQGYFKTPMCGNSESNNLGGCVPAFFQNDIRPGALIPVAGHSPASSFPSFTCSVRLWWLFALTTRTCAPSSSTPTYPIFITTSNVQSRSLSQRARPLLNFRRTSTSPPLRPSPRPSSPTPPRCTTAPRQRCSQTSVPCPVVTRENLLTLTIPVGRAACGIGTGRIYQVTSLLGGPGSSLQVYPPYFSVSRTMPNDLLSHMHVYAFWYVESDDSDAVRTPPEPLLPGPPIAVRFGCRNASDAMSLYGPPEKIESSLLLLPHSNTPLKVKKGSGRLHSQGQTHCKVPRQESADGRIQRRSDFAVPTLEFEGCLGGF